MYAVGEKILAVVGRKIFSSGINGPAAGIRLAWAIAVSKENKYRETLLVSVQSPRILALI
jgi:hypothetical protein